MSIKRENHFSSHVHLLINERKIKYCRTTTVTTSYINSLSLFSIAIFSTLREDLQNMVARKGNYSIIEESGS